MNSPNTFSLSYSIASLEWFTSKSGRWAAALGFPLILGPVWCFAGHFTSSFLGTLSGLVLLAALVTSAFTDVRSHKIYNFVTYSALLWAVLINVIAGLLASDYDTSTRAVAQGPALLGGVGVAQSLVGAGLCFFITLLGYRLSGRGAGDVKIAAVIGALLGIHYGVYAVFYSYIVAAIAIIAWSVWTQGPLKLLIATLRTFGALLGPFWPFPPKAGDHTLLMQPIPLGPYFLIGTLLVVLEIVPL